MAAQEDELEIRVAAGVVVEGPDGKILLVHRTDDGCWALPGGGLEPGETWSDAATRECLEETGWEIELGDLLGIYSEPGTQVHRYPGGAMVQLCGAIFMARAIRPVGTPDGEVAEVAFFSLDNLPEPLFPSDRPVLDDLRSRDKRPFIR